MRIGKVVTKSLQAPKLKGICKSIRRVENLTVSFDDDLVEEDVCCLYNLGWPVTCSAPVVYCIFNLVLVHLKRSL